MDRPLVTPAAHLIATAIAAVAIAAVIAAAVACFQQASHSPLLTEDITWLLFETA